MNEEALRNTCAAYEEKLIELMGEDAFMEFSAEVAKTVFRKEIEALPDSDFKDFVLENYRRIVGGTE